MHPPFLLFKHHEDILCAITANTQGYGYNYIFFPSCYTKIALIYF